MKNSIEYVVMKNGKTVRIEQDLTDRTKQKERLLAYLKLEKTPKDDASHSRIVYNQIN